MKLGVLLMNTGTADEPTVEAIARYLGEPDGYVPAKGHPDIN